MTLLSLLRLSLCISSPLLSTSLDARLSLFLLSFIALSTSFQPSSRLPLHAVLSPAALLCRIALFVKPTTPSSLPPSWLYRTPPRLRRIRGDPQSSSQGLSSHTLSRFLVWTPHIVWFVWEIVFGREPPWSLPVGALLNGTCWMVYNLSGDWTSILVYRPVLRWVSEASVGDLFMGVAVCQGPIRSAC